MIRYRVYRQFGIRKDIIGEEIESVDLINQVILEDIQKIAKSLGHLPIYESDLSSVMNDQQTNKQTVNLNGIMPRYVIERSMQEDNL